MAGARRHDLIAYFGAAAFEELVPLAVAARAATADLARSADAPRVWLLPGIMGTQLGHAHGGHRPGDLLWLDPLDIIAGRITALRLREGDAIEPLGALLYNHLQLKLRLTVAGFAPRVFDYDWRRDPIATGARFAAALRADGREALIVAHSLGGLVARAAMTEARLPRIARVALLGTPNAGSYAALQALRGSYPVVRRLAMLDRSHDAEWLASRVFNTFESLYRLPPWGSAAGGTDFHARAAWPAHGPRPSARRLAAGRTTGSEMVPADDRFMAIAGCGEPTVVGCARGAAGFTYTVTSDGDGTVPLESAALPGAALYRTRTAHSELTRDATVAAALVDLLRTGHTRRLESGPGSPDDAAATATFTFTDAQMRAALDGKLDWSALSGEARREFLHDLNDLPELLPAAAT